MLSYYRQFRIDSAAALVGNPASHQFSRSKDSNRSLTENQEKWKTNQFSVKNRDMTELPFLENLTTGKFWFILPLNTVPT